MSTWRRKLLEIFPESKGEIEAFYSMVDSWMWLNRIYINAYVSGDDRGAMKVIGHYRWSVSPEVYPIPNELQSCAAISFLEYNTLSDDRLASLFRYLTYSEIIQYSHLIAYAHKMTSHEEVVMWLDHKIAELNIEAR